MTAYVVEWKLKGVVKTTLIHEKGESSSVADNATDFALDFIEGIRGGTVISIEEIEITTAA